MNTEHTDKKPMGRQISCQAFVGSVLSVPISGKQFLLYFSFTSPTTSPPFGSTAWTHTLLNASFNSGYCATSALARLADTFGWPKAAGLAMALVAVTLWGGAILAIYGRRRIPWRNWPTANRQTAEPFNRLVAIEWAGVIVAALAFSPNGQLVVAALPATLLATLLWHPPAGLSPRLRLVSAILTLAIAIWWAPKTDSSPANSSAISCCWGCAAA